jgi:N-acetylmuramoyl-L-alanine amidase
MTLEQTVADSNSKKADLHLALHSNAGAGGKGTECYYYYASKSGGKAWAKCIYDAVAPLTISSDRGVRPDNILYNRGLYETRSTNATACLIEIMFHDNQVDVTDYLGKVDQIAQAIAKAIYRYLNLNYLTNQNQKNYEKILHEVSPWSNIYIEDLKTMHKPDHNWHGLIEKLYYTIPK